MMNRSGLNLPDESFTYGKALRPSTPIRDVLGNFYGDVAEHMMQSRYDYMRKDTSQGVRLPSSNRHTRASALAKSHIIGKQVDEQIGGQKNVFKMKKFLKIEPRTNSNNLNLKVNKSFSHG